MEHLLNRIKQHSYTMSGREVVDLDFIIGEFSHYEGAKILGITEESSSTRIINDYQVENGKYTYIQGFPVVYLYGSFHAIQIANGYWIYQKKANQLYRIGSCTTKKELRRICENIKTI